MGVEGTPTMDTSIAQDVAQTYRVACVATVHLEPRSTIWTTLPADSVICGRDVLPLGWVGWEQDGTIRGYLHRGDLDIVQDAAS